MGKNNLQDELAAYQAEVMKIQTKYAANPTPANIAKMQKEMFALSQKMSELSMQIAAESYDAMSMDDDDGYDEEAVQKFVSDNPPPKDKAKYLPIGALLLLTNGEPYETFALIQDQGDWLEAMEGAWGIKEAEEGKKMLRSLLKGRHEAKFGDAFRSFKNKKPHELDDDSIDNYKETLNNLKEDCPVLLPFVKKCNTLLAWDFERAGYLARIFAHLGWIDLKETFEWLEKTTAKIKENFSGWEEYAASILVGRAVAFSFDYQVIAAVQELFEEKKGFLKGHPFSSL